MSLELGGMGVSNGIAIGKARFIMRHISEIPKSTIAAADIEQEIQRLQKAFKKEREQLHEIKNSIPEDTPGEVASFIDTHLLMLNDELLTEVPAQIIRESHCNAEWALKQQRDQLVAVFDAMEDPYLRTRKDDIDHVIHGVLRILMNIEDASGTDAEAFTDQIIVADDLTPADTVLLQQKGIVGIITEFGSPLSHAAILARSLGVPAIAGVHGAERLLQESEVLIIDGTQGLIIGDADKKTLKQYRKAQRQHKKQQAKLELLNDQPSRTTNNIDIQLLANFELQADMRALKRIQTDGIGLYRTEFLFMNRNDKPSEEEQFKTYRRVVKAMKGKTVTIRTLDLGADKHIDSILGNQDASNPALGLRGIRYCLQDHSLFMPQLRAILRAASFGDVRIMFPMLTNPSEIDEALDLLDEAKRYLSRHGFRYGKDVKIGAMIEVPAAAICADQFAKKLDFLSIGTNDLIQYTLAIDRIDDQVNYLYEPMHPSVLHLIQNTIAAGIRHNTPVAMCGEMAGTARYTRLLLGMGLRQFSMQANNILQSKNIVINSSTETLEPLAQQILECSNPQQIQKLLDAMNADLEFI